MAFALADSPDLDVKSLGEEFEDLPLERVLGWCWERFGEKAAIGTSFQGAGLVIIHHAVKLGFRFPVFTLDTGLLFPETVELKSRLEDFFGLEIEGIEPEQTVAGQAAAHGPELWKTNPDTCCTLRKVLPLQRKLGELDVWITGRRRQQSDDRSGIRIIELYHYDNLRGQYLVKMNPVAAWSREAIWGYLREHKIPYNPLHDRGYRSIGCWP